MKQKNKQPFDVHFIFRKKMLETGGMDFNDQITKKFFNNVFTNEMHKIFTGYFIPAIYIAYCTMFHGMNNQFEILRVKYWDDDDGNFSRNLEQKWGRFQKNLEGPPFILSILINQFKFVNVLYDIGYLFYGIVDSKFIKKYGLKRIKIIVPNMQRYDGLANDVCNKVISIRFNINGHVKNSFCYVAFKLRYDWFWENHG